MITNDIQELLEGALGDERMAELLHTLSVSPEKRAAFRQHMTLQGTMQRDRAASALTSAEDAAAWSAIASSVQAPAQIPAGGGMALRFPSWLTRAAAVIVVGVGGYLLGSNSSTNIFSDGTSDPTVAVNATTRTSPIADATQTPASDNSVSTASPAVASGSVSPPVASVTPSGARRATGTGATVMSPLEKMKINSSNGGSGTPEQATNTMNNGYGTEGSVNTPHAAHGSQTAETTNGATTPQQSPDGKGQQQPVDGTQSPADQKNNTVLPPTTPVDLKRPSDQPAELPIETTIAALRTNGLEIAFSEQLGMITPPPAGINDPDPEFSNRSLDISYRFFGGSIGAGLRATYGTFSSVHLEAEQQNDIGVVTFVPKLEAKKGLSFGGFVNYRLPLSSRFALGVEASYTGSSTTYQRYSGDIFALWFVTDRIAMQLGGGGGIYEYNLQAEREQLFRDHPNVGITSDASDRYKGNMIEARYGLLYRF